MPTETIEDIHKRMDAEEAATRLAADKAIQENYYKVTLSAGLGLLGSAAGIMLAVKRKSGIWGGIGWFILLGMAGSGIGYVAGSVIDGKPK